MLAIKRERAKPLCGKRENDAATFGAAASPVL